MALKKSAVSLPKVKIKLDIDRGILELIVVPLVVSYKEINLVLQ